MKKMLSGIKATGRIQLGNYITMKEFVKYQEEYEMFIFVANLHSMTIYQEPKILRQNTKDLIALYVAAGLDTNKATIFLQSDILEHAQLGWYFTCITSMGELNRMTQYKDKANKGDVIGTGIYVYPTLMAADILLYNPDYVPVGDDQKQHVELTRDIAERFNKRYSDTFTIPEPVIQKVGKRIMDLQDPSKKMSKSDSSEKGCIYVLDDINLSKKKILSAVTDSDNTIRYDPENKPGISNLLEIYACFSNLSIDGLVEKYQDCGYGVFKKDLAEVVGEELRIVQDKYNDFLSSGKLEEVLEEGFSKAKPIAYKMVKKVERKIGIDIKKRK